jgi:shikimate kinase
MVRIFLTGYMGAGKTTLGRVLSRRMNLSYIDTDHFIEIRYRKKISDLFATDGEARFREIEHRILCEVAEIENVIISTGGGLPCYHNNMEIMNRMGTTVYLDVPAEELAARLQAGKGMRPVLQNRSGSELIDFIRENLDKRRPFYEQAEICFNASPMCTKCEAEALAEKLELFIREHGECGRG